MYEVYIVAEEFRGARTVAQHRMVNDVSSLTNVKSQVNDIITVLD